MEVESPSYFPPHPYPHPSIFSSILWLLEPTTQPFSLSYHLGPTHHDSPLPEGRGASSHAC